MMFPIFLVGGFGGGEGGKGNKKESFRSRPSTKGNVSRTTKR